MKFSKAKRFIAACLVGASVLTSSAAALTGGFTYTYPIGIGTTYARQEGYNANGLQKTSVITYSPNSSVSPIGVRSMAAVNQSHRLHLRWKLRDMM